jgi:hypothetical protein
MEFGMTILIVIASIPATQKKQNNVKRMGDGGQIFRYANAIFPVELKMRKQFVKQAVVPIMASQYVVFMAVGKVRLGNALIMAEIGQGIHIALVITSVIIRGSQL